MWKRVKHRYNDYIYILVINKSIFLFLCKCDLIWLSYQALSFGTGNNRHLSRACLPCCAGTESFRTQIITSFLCRSNISCYGKFVMVMEYDGGVFNRGDGCLQKRKRKTIHSRICMASNACTMQYVYKSSTSCMINSIYFDF